MSKGHFDILGSFPDFSGYKESFIEDVSARTIAKVSNDFGNFVKTQRFASYFENQTGETIKTFGAKRIRGKTPAFAVRAGLGIKGSLNYLAGLYRGSMKTQSGKIINFSRKRNILEESWKAFEGKTPGYAEMLKGLMAKDLNNAVAKLL